MSQERYRGPKPRFVYRGLEAREDPSYGLTAADQCAHVSPQNAVSAHRFGSDVHQTQFIHCTRSAVAAIFYGSKWGGNKDACVVKIDLQKVDGYLLHDISSAQEARRHGLSGKALKLAVDAREILLEAAPQAGALIIPPAAITAYKVPLSMLSAQQRTPIRQWKHLLQKGQRMETFCAEIPARLEKFIVETIYEPRIYLLAPIASVYHFNSACPDQADGDVSTTTDFSRECPAGWRACSHCMMLGSDHRHEAQHSLVPLAGFSDEPVRTAPSSLRRTILAAIGTIVESSMAQELASHRSLERWISHVGGTFGGTQPDLCRQLREHYGSFKAFVVMHQAFLPQLAAPSLERVTSELQPTSPRITSTVCHFFWYKLGPPPLDMRLLNLLSLRSAAIHHTVWLWCYQSFSNIPVGVVAKDASELLPFDTFQEALKQPASSTTFSHKKRNKKRMRIETEGRHIAHLSDLFRVRVLRRFGGWWLDMDTIVLRPLPTALPYYFSTISEKQKDGIQAIKNAKMWAGKNTDFPDWDGKDSFQNTPIYIKQPNDPLTIEWDAKLTALVLNPCALPWLQVIREMEVIIVRKGLQRFVCPPIHFCPYPFWSMDSRFSRSPLDFATHASLPSFVTVLRHSYAVQTFFMSSSSKQTRERDDDWLRKEMVHDSHFRHLIIKLALAPAPGKL